jgi:ribosomal protein S18 acetylase RimI-like enzyme
MTLLIRRAEARDAGALATVAAVTFPMACPPHTTEQAKADFINGHLLEEHFAVYLADPQRDVLIAEVDGVAAGYTMLIHEEPYDPDVAAAVTVRPTVELSKFYVMPQQHGTGVAAALMVAGVGAARARGAAGVWLGVNEENGRANRFYEKCGFVVVGKKKFRMGEVDEDDFVREFVL